MRNPFKRGGRRRFASGPQRRPQQRLRQLLPVFFGLLFLVLALALWRIGGTPELLIEPATPGIGRSTEIRATARQGGRGLDDLELSLRQGERSWVLAEEENRPRPFWAFWGGRETEEVLTAVAGADLEGLTEGDATLRFEARRAGSFLRSPPPAVVEVVVPVRFRPPALAVLTDQVYVTQGGSSVVVYSVAETAVRHGVEAGGRFFPGFDLPGGTTGESFALFAAPYELDDGSGIVLLAEDELGNEGRRQFVDRFQPKPLARSTIRLDDAFLEKVVPEIGSRVPQVQGDDRLARYLWINGELRRRNAEELRALAERSAPRFLWKEPFRQQPNSQVMDTYAARRTYLYDGAEVDTQDHLGLDLASTRRAEIVAANAGTVMLADYFGIYGNTVILDHGYGLMTLYAHLSSIAVSEGEAVPRGGVVGRSGATGLAGGDHLHFAVLLQGEATSPIEWFDAKWIADRIAGPLGEALPYEL